MKDGCREWVRWASRQKEPPPAVGLEAEPAGCIQLWSELERSCRALLQGAGKGTRGPVLWGRRRWSAVRASLLERVWSGLHQGCGSSCALSRVPCC